MDTQKDNTTDKENTKSIDLSHKNIDPISYFKENSPFVFVYKKTEKLTTALYMVTNFFSDNEPMKWALRKKISDLLSFAVTYKDTPASQRSDFSHSVKSRILEIVSLLEVSSRSGLVSPMNFSILKQEFVNLIETLAHNETVHTDTQYQSLSSNFFQIAKENTESVTPTHTTNKQIESTPVGQMATYPMSDIQYTQPKNVFNNVSDNTVSAEVHDVFKKNNRQTIILNLIKKKKEVTIKDIAQIIRDCSEKTIQRELVSLISANVLKKEGVRRWSKYSLVI
jgi:hypothetical protein